MCSRRIVLFDLFARPQQRRGGWVCRVDEADFWHTHSWAELRLSEGARLHFDGLCHDVWAPAPQTSAQALERLTAMVREDALIREFAFVDLDASDPSASFIVIKARGGGGDCEGEWIRFYYWAHDAGSEATRCCLFPFYCRRRRRRSRC